jgi:hypothetical protein
MLHVYISGSLICQPMLKIKRNETNAQNKVGPANNCVQQWINGLHNVEKSNVWIDDHTTKTEN